MKRLVCSLVLLLAACGGDGGDSLSYTNSNPNSTNSTNINTNSTDINSTANTTPVAQPITSPASDPVIVLPPPHIVACNEHGNCNHDKAKVKGKQ